MGETDIRGIVFDKITLNEMNVAFMRKLETFGCAMVLDEQGNDKHGKAQLAVLSAVFSSKNPSILVITTRKLMYAWYQSLLTGIGADFKFIHPDERSINHFSPKLSNLFIANEAAWGNPVFAKVKEAGFVWDLVIVDGGLAQSGINTEFITDNFDIKTKKLVVFAPYLTQERDAAEKLSKIPEKFLEDEGRAKYFADHFADETVLDFTLDSPFTHYYGKENLDRPSIRVIPYTVSEDILKARADQNGSSLYNHGGNIFEELTLDMRKLYVSERYDDDVVTKLRGYDAKLDAYLTELDRLLEDPDSRVITYFSSEKTLEYIYKALNTSVVGLGRITAVKKTGLHRINDTLESFKAGAKNDIRIVLSVDDQYEECGLISNITHVINYELPDSPMILHRRYKQGGTVGFKNPEFVMFRDDTDQFDGRILSCAMALNIIDGFSFNIPGRNIYIYTEGLEEMLADMMAELNDVEDMNEGEVTALIAKYNLNTTPDHAKIALCYGRDAVRTAFGLPEASEDETDRDALVNLFREKLAELRDGCAYLDFSGTLFTKKYDIEQSKDYATISRSLSKQPLSVLRDKARKALDDCGTAENCIDILRETDEHLKSFVYYCAWRYMTESCGLQSNYDEFLKSLFEEVI